MTPIEERKNLIETNVRHLQNTEIDSDDFFHFQGVKHTLQEAIEACIDISSHIISIKGWGRGEDYTDYFRTLEDQNLITEELSENLQEKARFMNLVVHRYTEIEAEELQRIIEDDLDDFISFVQQIGESGVER